MFNSSVFKHINKWGKNSGNICGRPSKKKDSRCHKHRYRFLQILNRIYTSFKYLFNMECKIISNKNQTKKFLKQKEEEEYLNKLEYEKNNSKDNITKKEHEDFQEYIERIDRYTCELLKIKNEKIVYGLIIDTLYKELNSIYRLGTKEWCNNSNLIMVIKRKYFYYL